MKNKETLEEAAERLADIPKHLKGKKYEWSAQDRLVYNMFVEGAKWQAERMYSEEDLREAFRQGHKSSRQFGSYNKITEQEDYDKWFEQFKKK